MYGVRDCSDFVDLYMALQLSEYHFLKRLFSVCILVSFVKDKLTMGGGFILSSLCILFWGAFFAIWLAGYQFPNRIEPVPSAVEIESLNQWTTREFLGLSFLFRCSRCLFLYQYHTVLITIALKYYLKSGRVELPAFVLFPKDCFGNSGSLWFHIHFRIFLVL